jgi:hypothetical protein
MAEIELSALSLQGLKGKRIPSVESLNAVLSGWFHARNANQKGIDWRFTTADARIKLKHLYPVVKFLMG